jgi:FAD dependent oxidoreductase TIGR03364
LAINRTAIVVGAGITGLAMARALAIKGYNVTVIEKNYFAIGASIRNFGMIWPIGQPAGAMYERALQSKSIWKSICREANLWHHECGSIHALYNPAEMQVAAEVFDVFNKTRPVQFLTKEQTQSISPIVNPNGLVGSLYSADEMLINPVEAIYALPEYLSTVNHVNFIWGKCVSYINQGTVYIGNEEQYEADVIVICSGTDFETLYPECYAELPLAKCKLQMMRAQSNLTESTFGPALCGGLSLAHYKSFEVAPSLPQLKEKFAKEMPDYIDNGIHVMACINNHSEITIGDSHEYNSAHLPFIKTEINQLILDYLNKIASIGFFDISQYWYGEYAKLTTGGTELFFSPEEQVYFFNAVGGAGMTLSFGLADELTKRI